MDWEQLHWLAKSIFRVTNPLLFKAQSRTCHFWRAPKSLDTQLQTRSCAFRSAFEWAKRQLVWVGGSGDLKNDSMANLGPPKNNFIKPQNLFEYSNRSECEHYARTLPKPKRPMPLIGEIWWRHSRNPRRQTDTEANPLAKAQRDDFWGPRVTRVPAQSASSPRYEPKNCSDLVRIKTVSCQLYPCWYLHVVSRLRRGEDWRSRVEIGGEVLRSKDRRPFLLRIAKKCVFRQNMLICMQKNQICTPILY